MTTFTKTNTDNLFGLSMAMYYAKLKPNDAHELLKSALSNSKYEIDGIELELYQFKMQCRDGLNKEAEQWADSLIDLWVNS